MDNPQISIIIPVYNVDKYLNNCLESVLSQSIANFEVLLIDDGSTDQSGKICDEYAKKDSRIRVFHQKNGGVSSARNKGILYAKGEWITFIDSDDYVSETFLNDFGLSRYKADIYLQGYQVEMNGKVFCKHVFPVQAISNVPFVRLFVEGEKRNIINSPCCKLFKRVIIATFGLAFDTSISFGEDHLFVLSYLYYAQRFVLSPAAGYHYVHSKDESLTNRIIPVQELIHYIIHAYQYQHRLLQKVTDDFSNFTDAINWRTYSNMAFLLKNYLSSNNKYSLSEYRYIHAIYKSLTYSYSGLNTRRKCIKFIFDKMPVCCSYYIFRSLVKSH